MLAWFFSNSTLCMIFFIARPPPKSMNDLENAYLGCFRRLLKFTIYWSSCRKKFGQGWRDLSRWWYSYPGLVNIAGKITSICKTYWMILVHYIVARLSFVCTAAHCIYRVYKLYSRTPCTNSNSLQGWIYWGVWKGAGGGGAIFHDKAKKWDTVIWVITWW